MIFKNHLLIANLQLYKDFSLARIVTVTPQQAVGFRH